MNALARVARPLLALLVLVSTARDARAGLVFETDDSKAPPIQAARSADKLIFSAASGHRTVTLAPSTSAAIINWLETTKHVGPIVFSIDGSLVPGAPGEYAPPGLPGWLASRLFSLDGYAHQLACGGVTADALAHPLVATLGPKLMPAGQYESLLDKENNSVESFWYKRLASHYAEPPACIGELTFRTTVAGASLLTTQVDSWIHEITTRWYRDVDVPSEWDRWAARLPYAALKKSIESDWPAYRKAFPRLEELTSFAEGIALLNVVRQKSSESWSELLRQVREEAVGGYRSTYDDRYNPDSAYLSIKPMDPKLWETWSARSLSGGVRTPADGNLALDLLMSRRSNGEYSAPTTPAARVLWEGVEIVAPQDPRLTAKLALAKFLTAPSDKRRAALAATLTALRSNYSNAFRLRATGLNLIESISWSDAEARVALKTESKALIDELVQRVESRCTAPKRSDDLVWWESRSQDVYSTKLTARATRYSLYNDKLIGALACIHFRRGMAEQQGRVLAFRHAHFRFLGYLLARVQDQALKALIGRNQETLAKAMGLSEVTPPVEALLDDYYEDSY